MAQVRADYTASESVNKKIEQVDQWIYPGWSNGYVVIHAHICRVLPDRAQSYSVLLLEDMQTI